MENILESTFIFCLPYFVNTNFFVIPRRCSVLHPLKYHCVNEFLKFVGLPINVVAKSVIINTLSSVYENGQEKKIVILKLDVSVDNQCTRTVVYLSLIHI